MEQLIAHIDLLLNEHQCVVVPKLGTFLALKKEAQFMESGTILPPSIEFRFTKEELNDNNLLVSSIAELEDISIDDAVRFVDAKVEELLWVITLEERVCIGKIGTLTMSSQQKIQFTTCKNRLSIMEPLNSLKCTLEPLPAKPKNKRQAEGKIIIESAESIQISLQKKTIRALSTSVAAIIFFLLFSTPITNEGQNSNYASVISSELFLNSFENSKSLIMPDAEISVEELMEQTQFTEQEVEYKESEVVNNQIEEPHHYYIVVSSIQANADLTREVDKLHKKGYDKAGALVKSNKVRIYLKSFPKSERNIAQKELNKIREESAFSSAWLYASN
ncbi:MAG: hypothetical protein ACRC6R_07775 [Bacteroidales bacterium]